MPFRSRRKNLSCAFVAVFSIALLPGLCPSQTFVRVDTDIDSFAHLAIGWGDYDNDGDLDIILSGITYWFHPSTFIYRNDGNHTFVCVDGGVT